MIPDRVCLVDLSPNNLRIARNALEPLGWRLDEVSSTQAAAAITPDGTVEILIREKPRGEDEASCSRRPTLWLLPRGTLIPQASGEGPQDFVHLPAHREEIAARARCLARIAALEMEIRRHQREVAYQVDRRRGIMSAVANELASPLSAVIEYLEMLLDGTAGEIREPQRRLLLEAKGATGRIAERVEEMVDASRTEAGMPIGVRLDRVDLKPLVEGLLEWAIPRLRCAGQELAVHLEPDLPPICGDAERLNQAFRHLIDNAHRYSPRGARIEIGAARDPDVQGFARITVADDGPGLSNETLAQLLEPFPRKGVGGGRPAAGGVGLSLVRAIAIALGGEIHAADRAGGGTGIGMRLPLWDSRAARIAEAQALLASPSSVAGSDWLCRATTPEETAVLGSGPSLMVLSPGEILAICETPPDSVPCLGRTREFREAGSLAKALQPRLRVRLAGAGRPAES